MDMNSLGKTLILFGILFIVFGAIFMLGGKLSWFGRLPGDIYVEKKGFSFYFPITTCILISIILSIVFILLRRR
ncbi:MAG: DUF2905 domain-containing protein [Candidatus Omnitrophota bacterium]